MEKLVLIDGHSILNRAFYGVPDLTNSSGLHTNAIYGFLNILFKILEEEKPDYLTVAFDVHAPTFRHEIYKEYKGTRKPMPEELREHLRLMISWEHWQNNQKNRVWLCHWYLVTGIFCRLQQTGSRSGYRRPKAERRRLKIIIRLM